jgi:hypothetical protein
MSDIQKNINLNSNETKREILRYISNHIKINSNVGNFYSQITKDKDLDAIMNPALKYSVSLEKMGVRSWYLFFKMNNVYYAITMPFSSLLESGEWRIFPITLKVNKSLYEGTIFEGVYVLKNQLKYVFINEVYLLEGNTMINYMRKERMIRMVTCIEKNFARDTDYIFDIDPSEPIFDQDQEKISIDQIKKLYAKTKSDSTISSWIFYPNRLYDTVFYYHLRQNDRMDEITRAQTFKIKKTNTTDVYILYDSNERIVGEAYVENIQASKSLREQFEKLEKKSNGGKKNKNNADVDGITKGTNNKDTSISPILWARCVYSPVFNKWKPIALFEAND